MIDSLNIKLKSLLELYTKEELDDLLTRYDLDYVYGYSLEYETEIGSIESDIKNNVCLYASSADGWSRIDDFVHKDNTVGYKVKFDDTELLVAGTHLFETVDGWELTEDIEGISYILHKSGEYKKCSIEKLDHDIPIVDIIIDHPNHRYYSEGLSSHNTNAGKSSLMCYNAAEWIRDGKNVLYFTMEMSEEAIQERVDMNLLDCSSNDLRNLNQDTFMNKIRKLASANTGTLKVKEFPTGEPNANHFKTVIKELKQKQNFIPDVVIIDYINICSSVRYSAGGTNTYSYIKAIAEELRGLAVSENVAILSATQTNREGSTKSDPGMDSISDSFGLAMTADWICALSATEELVEMGQVMAILLKTRYGNKSSAKPQVIAVNYDRMRYSDISMDNVNQTKESLAKLRETKNTKDIDWG